MIILSLKNISKSYGIETILDNISFSVNEGEKIGIIGANGAGKSTLFKILCGDLSYDDGERFVDKSKKLGYLSQNLSLDFNNTIYTEVLTVFENLISMENRLSKMQEELSAPYDETNKDYHDKLIEKFTTLNDMYETLGGYTYKGEISKVTRGLGFLEEDFNKSIGILSGGQKTRVALVKLLLSNPDIILLDEPTNHLDLAAIEWLEEYLKSYKGTLLIISHDRYFLDAITNKTIEVTKSRVNVFKGNYTSSIPLKEKLYEEELKAYNLQQAEIKRQEEIIKKFKQFNREKSIRAAESRQKLLDKMEVISAPVNEKVISNLSFETEINSGNDVLFIENLSKSYGEKLLFSNIDFSLHKGDKVALVGENGGGKTTLLKIIMDKIKADKGIKILGKNVTIGYYDQEQSNLDENKSILDEVWDSFPELTTTEIRTALASFLFKNDDVFKLISNLSGGEKCRINLLKLMLSGNNFLLLDEPTNHLDIPSREALEKAILSYDGTILLISHDRYFLNKVVQRIVELEESRLNSYLGNYSYYIDKKTNPKRFDVEVSLNGKTQTQIKNEKRKKRDDIKREKELKNKITIIEKELIALEKSIEDFNADLCLEEVYSNPLQSAKINAAIKNCEEKIANLYDQWEKLTLEIEEC